jgi:hypothetical protein
VKVFFYVVRGVLADINAIVHHHLFRYRIDHGFYNTGAINSGFVASKITQIAFGHLAPTTIAGAKN